MQDLYHLCYKSVIDLNAITQPPFEAVDKIVKASRLHNTESGITGCLIFTGTHFLQEIEGDHADVNAIYRMICQDYRHTNLRILDHGPRVSREFPDAWKTYAEDRSAPDCFLTEISKEIDNTGICFGKEEAMIILSCTAAMIADDQNNRMLCSGSSSSGW